MSIVVGYIDTPEGHAALDHAIEEAKLRDEKLVVLHSSVGGASDSAVKAIAITDALERAEAQMKAAGVHYQTHDYVRGNTPAEDIISAAEEFDGSLIVIGVRRRSSTGKLLLGSNALDVLHDADVPVLCVKPAG